MTINNIENLESGASVRGKLNDVISEVNNLGTISSQDSNNVTVTGGTINGTTIGATTPSTGVFTSITGTAVTQSATDTTAGRLTKVGDFGLGGTLSISDFNVEITPGLYGWTSVNVPNRPPNAARGTLIVGRRSATNITQLAVSEVDGEGVAFRNTTDAGSNWSDWRDLYFADNILGTVSQSSGVPTGAIIERGSNANGEFVRYADGTQICWCAPFEFDCGATIPQTVASPASFVSRATSKAVGTIIFDDGGTGSGFTDALLAFQNSKVTMDISTSNEPRLRGTGAANEKAIVLVAMFGRWF